MLPLNFTPRDCLFIYISLFVHFISETNQLRGQRSVGIQEKPNMKDGCSQTYDHATELTQGVELGNAISPKEHIGKIFLTYKLLICVFYLTCNYFLFYLAKTRKYHFTKQLLFLWYF